MDQRYQYIKLLKNNSNYDGKKRQNILEVNLLHELIACFYEIYVFEANISKSIFPGNSRDPGIFSNISRWDREFEKAGKLKTLLCTRPKITWIT